jgi:hypothetical protein
MTSRGVVHWSCNTRVHGMNVKSYVGEANRRATKSTKVTSSISDKYYVDSCGRAEDDLHANKYHVVPPAPYLDYVMVGEGTAYVSCGTFSSTAPSVYACRNHPSNVKVIRQNCNRLDCPICAQSAVAERTDRIVARLRAYRRALNRQGLINFKFLHVSVHVEDKKRAISFIRRFYDNAVMFRHGWRLSEGIAEVSPHFHAIVCVCLDENNPSAHFLPPDCRSVDGFTAKLHKAGNSYYHSLKAISTKIAYILGHTAVKKRSHAYTYHGSLGYRAFSVKKVEKKQACRCPDCLNAFERFYVKKTKAQKVSRKLLDDQLVDLYQQKSNLKFWEDPQKIDRRIFTNMDKMIAGSFTFEGSFLDLKKHSRSELELLFKKKLIFIGHFK